MEVYVGEEYCGTGRGQNFCTIQNDRNDKVTLYKKYLKLEYSTTSCRIKLLSIGERQRVLLTKIVVQLDDGNKHFEKSTMDEEEGIQTIGMEQQPICSYLEKVISKNMELMEKKLMDYIDLSMQKLQEHIDTKVVLLMDMVQNSKTNKMSQEHYDSGEGLSNGER
ncbi:Putative protein C10orf88 [Chelonia mydas]|uniref:Uncharacterized protein n=1 Tax=Chelonia mydas TaxID=8469 RepID=M7CBY4_CHEMY|nr:Putative protein C10orf88 [Chelonia mydas]